MGERDAHSLANKPIVKDRDPLFVAARIRRIRRTLNRPARVYIKPCRILSSFF